MKLLNDILNNVPEFGQLLAAMDSGRCPVALSGLSAVHLSLIHISEPTRH